MSGGIRALHVLRDELRARGQDAWMSYEAVRPGSIVVYPEIVRDNPLEADTYVRWLLNKADFPDVDRTWAWGEGMGTERLLTVDIIESELWMRSYGRRKTGVAYWVGKGQFDASVIPPGAEEISRSNHPDRTELAEYVSSLEMLISFDPYTALVAEAVVAGTPVLIRSGDEAWSKAEVERQGWVPYGVAWSEDELDWARLTVGMAAGHYDSMRSTFSARIDAFVGETQE